MTSEADLPNEATLVSDETIATVESAAALIVGSEVLSGKIRDENLPELSSTLRALGIDLRRAIICPDDTAAIAGDLRALLANHDVVFTSGGLGPTHDDLTVAGVCRALDVPAETNPQMLRIIEKIYGERTTDTHRLMAQIPRGARLIETGGWPLIVAQRIWLLPGVPALFKSKLIAVRGALRGPTHFHSRALRVVVDEALIKEQLDEVVRAHSSVEIGSYPKWFDPSYQTLITLDSRSPDRLDSAFEHLTQLLLPFLASDSD